MVVIRVLMALFLSIGINWAIAVAAFNIARQDDNTTAFVLPGEGGRIRSFACDVVYGSDAIAHDSEFATLSASNHEAVAAIMYKCGLPLKWLTTRYQYCYRSSRDGNAVKIISDPANKEMTVRLSRISIDIPLGHIKIIPLTISTLAILCCLLGTHFLFLHGIYTPRKRLRRRNSNRCLQCGYDLATTKSMCPECGSHFDIVE